MDYIIVWVWPLCGGEAQEEEEADQEDEGDGAADVGHRPHRRDGHSHLLLRVLHGHHQGSLGHGHHIITGHEAHHKNKQPDNSGEKFNRVTIF